VKHGPENDSTFIRHVPCEDCGSSDANSLYTDGHTHCFSCGKTVQGDGAFTQQPARKRVAGLIEDVEIRRIKPRKISEETCSHFGYGYGEYKGEPVQVAPYYDKDGNLVAQKIRFKDKRFKLLGSLNDAELFGARAWNRTGRKVVVTEGEIDALTMSQVQGNKWPVVSIACGAGAQIKKYFAKHLDYFRGFEEVIIMFDMDEPGRQASEAAARVIGARAKIASLPLKDPNEMLLAGRVEELTNAMWRAVPYKPEGIVSLEALKAQVLETPQMGLSYPFPALTKATFGIRPRQLIALGAGTGIGKTDFFAQTIAHLLTVHKVPVGVFSFEQAPSETAIRIAGKFVEKRLHIPDGDWTDEDRETAFDTMASTGKLFFYDSFGNTDWESVKEKIEYLCYSEGVKHFFIDHLTAIAAWEDDERKALEMLMSEMSALAVKLESTIFFISHLATPEGKPHEEGGRVMIRHFKGSRSIGFWSHFMFGMERAQQDESEIRRQITTFRILKDRFTGNSTGTVIYLGFDQKTGMLYEMANPDLEEDEDDDD